MSDFQQRQFNEVASGLSICVYDALSIRHFLTFIKTVEPGHLETEMRCDDMSSGEATESDVEDGGLEDAVQDEHEYLHGRLREELGREPTEEELNEWLRRHTEGY